MSTRYIRIVAAALAALSVAAAVWLLWRVERTTLTNMMGVMLAVTSIMALFIVLRPATLFMPELRRVTRSRAVDGCERNRVEKARDLPSQSQMIPPPLVVPKELLDSLAELRSMVRAIGTDIASLKRDLPPRFGKLEEAIEGLRMTVTDIREDDRQRQPQRPARSLAGPEEETIEIVGEPLVGVAGDNLHTRLRDLAERCMSRGFTVKRVKDEIPYCHVDTLDGSETPDAFLVSVTPGQDMWVVPNTREWLPFRGLGWFEVAGQDVVSARIQVLRRLPRLGRARKLLEPGAVEVGV